MKRSGPWQRKTPLMAKSPAKRSQQLTRAVIKAKRKKVTPEERNARKVVQARAQGACEVCGAAGVPLQMHHRKKAGRVWAPENLLAVCGLGNYSGCHGRIEQNPNESKRQGWWLLPIQDLAKTAVWLFGREFVFLLPDGSIQQVDDESEGAA